MRKPQTGIMVGKSVIQVSAQREPLGSFAFRYTKSCKIENSETVVLQYAQKPWIVPIPGMDKVEYIDDNIKSVDIELTSEELERD